MRRPLSLGGEGPPCILSVNYVMKIYYKFLWKSIKGGKVFLDLTFFRTFDTIESR